MKKLCIFIITRLLSFISCIGFACIGPINTSKVCNVITNLDEFNNEYYAVIACHGNGCDNKGGHYLLEPSDNCIEGGGRVFFIPNSIPYNSLEFNFNMVHAGGREIEIGYVDDVNRNCDGSDADEETNIYKIVKYETGINMELIHTYKGYDIRSGTEINKIKNVTKTHNTAISYLPIFGIIIAICVVASCVFILNYITIKFFKNKKD